MDDGQDEADAIDVSEKDAEQKEVEMDFNTLIQTTAPGQQLQGKCVCTSHRGALFLNV